MRKKSRIYILLALLSLPFMPACNAQLAQVPDTAAVATKVLGDSISHLLFTADSVTVYLLKGKELPDSTDIIVSPDGYVRDTLSCPMPADSLAALRTVLLSDSSSYFRDTTYSIRSPYMPVLELEFVQGEISYSILLSLTNHTWTVSLKGHQLFNFPYRNVEATDRIALYLINRLRNSSK